VTGGEPALTPARVLPAMLRQSFPPAALVGFLAALAVGVVQGWTAGVSAVVGVAVALVFFASGLVLMARFVRSADPMLFMAVGMSVYGAQVLGLLGVLIVARNQQSLDLPAAGLAMFVTILAWQAAQIRAWRRARVPVYDTDAGADPTEPRSGR
jgi:ATP synthase protein I